MSIKNYKYEHGGFVFEFDPDPIDTTENHILVPMVLTCATFYGLVLIDCNDCAVYKAKNAFLFARGTTTEKTMNDGDFICIGTVLELLNDDAHFGKTI